MLSETWLVAIFELRQAYSYGQNHLLYCRYSEMTFDLANVVLGQDPERSECANRCTAGAAEADVKRQEPQQDRLI